MSFEDELGTRLRSSVEGLSPEPDLAAVEARSASVARRRQRVLAGSVVALVLLAVGSVALVSGRNGSTQPAVSPVDTSPTDSAPAETTADGTVPPDTSAVTTIVDGASETPATASTVVDTMLGSVGVDRADDYLEGSTEIYRRTLPNGDEFVARLSDATYASVFGLEWHAPTGSADECLGDHAVFIGVPARVGYWGSAWVADRWTDDLDLSQPVVVASMMAAEGGAMVDPTVDTATHVLVRTAPEVRQVVVVDPAGNETDRADAVSGLAMVRAPASWSDAGPPRLAVVNADGAQGEPVPFEYAWNDAGTDDACSPGPAPQQPLPTAGEQPPDARSAEKQIRQRHALLVDRSIPADDKPDDLLDDDTGVADAVAQVDAGQYADSASGATFHIDELVFTDPDTAWFRYTITAPTGTFPDRFGMATYNGAVWQITRATICGDLALAGGNCQPPPPRVEPPPNPDWEAAYQDWNERASQYTAGDGCSPLSQC